MSLFSDLFGGGYQDAAKAQIQGLQQGYNQASDLYGQGRSTIGTYGAAGLAPWTSLAATTAPGVSAYGQAVGLGMPGTTAGAVPGAAGAPTGPTAGGTTLDWLQNQPGYQFALGQGLQAIDRGAAARGMVTSGNTLEAEQGYGTGLAQQYYQNYVNNLLPYLNMQPGIASGITGANQWTGGGLASSLGQQGNLAFNTQAGIGQAQSAADIAAQNAQNSFIGGIAGLGTQLLGFGLGGGFSGGPGAASLASSIFGRGGAGGFRSS